MQLKLFPVFLLLFHFCTEPYDPKTENDRQVPAIYSLVTDIPGQSYVDITVAVPYDSMTWRKGISGAMVFITDNSGGKTPFTEASDGRYVPVNSTFSGKPGKSYVLTVEMPDKQVYVSSPQEMLPQVIPFEVSGKFGKETYLLESYYGKVIQKEKEVCEIYYDLKYTGPEQPEFRFISTQIVEYTVFKPKFPPFPVSGYMFYCWYVIADSSLVFTNEKYKTNSGGIQKIRICSTTPDKKIQVPDMSLMTMSYDKINIDTDELRRIIRISQYRLNPDSYAWYKGVDNQNASQGKIFDPLIAQLYGNLSCQTNPDQPILGFFEVSSVAVNSWSVSRDGKLTSIIFKSVPNVFPPPSGFTVNVEPDFWID